MTKEQYRNKMRLTVPVALRDDFKKKLHEMEQINLEKPCRASLLQREDGK